MMLVPKKITAGCLAATMIFMNGCANLGQTGIVNKSYTHSNQDATVSIAKVGDESTNSLGVQDVDRSFLNGQQVSYVPKKQDLPDIFSDPHFVMSLLGHYSLNQIAAELSRTLNMPVQNDTKDMIGTAMVMPTTQQSKDNGMNDIHFEGTLSDFLSMVSSYFDVYWKYDPNKQSIVFKKYETHQFMIESALPTTTSINNSTSGSTISGISSGGGSAVNSGNAGVLSSTNGSTNTMSSTLTGMGGNIGGGAGGGGTTTGGGGTQTSVSASSNFDFWTGINKMLTGLIGKSGVFVTDPNTGMVEVTTTPEHMNEVTQYIQELNHQLHQMVSIDVRILVVNDSNNDDYGMQWQALTKTTKGTFSMTGTPPVNATGASASYTVLNPLSKWANTNLIINAMTQNVKVVQNKHYPVVVNNDQPAPLSETTNYTYIASAGAVAIPNSGVQSSVTPGTITVGLNMTIIPRIQANGRIVLSVAANLSSLLGLNSVSSGGETIQEPQVSNQSFMEQIELQNNSTAVLLGFETKAGQSTAQGVGSAYSWLFGGGDQSTNSVNRLVFIITPHIMRSF